jgi:hypothetical protein
VFTAGILNTRNVVSPATADQALVNGSYSTRGFESYLGVGGGSIPAGEISRFSGRGKRIDERALVDLASPGNYDVFSPRSHQDVLGYPLGSYQQFSGTSAAALLLGQNYPNPFNPSTWIPFFLPKDGEANLTVYNALGLRVRVLRDRWYHKGPHSVSWDGRDQQGNAVASGVYFCTLSQAGLKQTRKIVLVR